MPCLSFMASQRLEGSPLRLRSIALSGGKVRSRLISRTAHQPRNWTNNMQYVPGMNRQTRWREMLARFTHRPEDPPRQPDKILGVFNSSGYTPTPTPEAKDEE